MHHTERSFETNIPVDRFKPDHVIVARLDTTLGKHINGEIYGGGSFVEQKEGRNVNSSSREIDPSRGGCFDYH